MANEPSIPPGRQFGSSEYYTHLLSTVHNPVHLREVASSPTTTPMNQTAFCKGLRSASLCIKLCASGSHTENVQHPRFYFSDGNVTFSVCTVLFKVHRYFFQRDSPIFSSMFSLPPPPGEEAEGETDEKPIKLSGFTSKDFERFLEVLYPESVASFVSTCSTMLKSCRDFCISELTGTEAWISVLKVATQWDFSSVRSLAVAKLSNLLVTSADRVGVGKQFDVQGWLGPAYMDLCIREQPLSLQEGQKLGIDDVIEIYRLRSLIRYNGNLNRHPDSIWTLVRQEFKC